MPSTSATTSSSTAPAPKDANWAFRYDPALFQHKKPPQSGDWMDRFPVRRQSFDAYTASSPTRRSAKRYKIVIQPLGSFKPHEREVLDKMREFASIFFDSPVTVSPARPLPKKGRRTRNDAGRSWAQHHTTVLLSDVLAPRLPESAICYLGITMGDLYPEPSWNYVFGQASLEERVGVYSLTRFFPRFWGEKSSPAAARKALRRSVHILAHESGHMFSLPHCPEYECLMNGSNSLEEMDRQVDMLCPSCLKKLHWNLGFDVRKRYERLRAFYRREKLTELAQWMDKRLSTGGGQP